MEEKQNNEEKMIHIIVPDEVDVDDATLESTQNEECKKYEVDAEKFKDYAGNNEVEDKVDDISEEN